jgi:hypothetical protein
LHLTDVSAGTDRVIEGPPQSDGFIAGGAFSPDAGTVAGFVLQRPAIGSIHAELVLVDVKTGHVAGPVADSAVNIGETIVAAAWSPTSHWLYFSGIADPMMAYHPATTKAIRLGEAPSYTYAVS